MELARNRVKFIDMEVRIVRVGSQEKTCSVHSSLLLTESSTFFKSAITGGFMEAVKNEVEMPEDNAGTFEVFVQWHYFGRVIRTKPSTNTTPERTTELNRMVDLCVLGDKIGCQALKLSVIREFYLRVQDSQFFLPHASVEHLYSRPIKAQPLRKLTIAFCVWTVAPGTFKTDESLRELLEKWPEFAQEVLIEMGSRFGIAGARDPRKMGVGYFLAKA